MGQWMKCLMLRIVAPVLGFALLGSGQLAYAQKYAEDFTGTTTNNDWYFTGGACLTAGSGTSTTVQPGPVAGCATVLNTYYRLQKDSDPSLNGGESGTLPDSPGLGALRFTNGAPYGHNQAGAIVSGFAPFPTSQGVQISFKTITYGGSAGGDGKDGADGISFFLMDGCVPLPGATLPAGCTGAGKVDYGTSPYAALGAIGGSLGYSCSNGNGQADGLVGAYLGLGIDEFGNFLNGAKNTLNEQGSTNKGGNGDNTVTGGYYQPGRIGLRGAGNINFQLLSHLYGTNPSDSTRPYYPASMASSCSINGGTFDSGRNRCESCSNGGTYDVTTHTCSKGNRNESATDAQTAVQKTCATATFYNYSNVNGPSAAGATDTTNTNNLSKILDYPAIPGGYTVLSADTPIANESATTRSQTAALTPTDKRAKPIVYNLNITQDGLLTFAYSYNGGAFQNVLTNTDIKTTNGALPSAFRFGFAGSTGGETNIHEIMCFKASPNEASASSGGLNTFENPQIVFGTQIFLASYFPTRAWAGQLTAQSVGFDTTSNSVVIKSVPNWDASCVLSGASTTNPCSTGQTNLDPEAPADRILLSWDGTKGIPFKWTNLTTGQKAAVDPEDLAAGTANRLNYLRGDRTNEIPKGSNLFRTRASVLGDIIDSSPAWVGPPSTYATNIVWVDALHAATQQPEGTGQTYAQFQTASQTRLNVVYVGSNDGFLHGFRAGSFDAKGGFVNNGTTPNDGSEVLGFMPATILQKIHSGTAALDYSNTQYAHAYFVDATPGTGDVFYGAKWHTWLVGGLGAGGAGIYALDVTDPSQFTNAKADSVVIGEWTPAGIPGGCNNSSNCGDNMGNISGVPQIRRFHNGKWGVIFGNGVASASGDAGIFIMLLDKSTGKPSFLYFSAINATKASPAGNGIVAVTAADLDSDHITDFVYAGDLKGNLWRFDVTNTNEASWGVSASSPLFKEPNGQPITTAVTVSTIREIGTRLGFGTPVVSHKPERIILNFGTGRMIPQTTSAATQYAPGVHYMYGIWDSDLSAWNTLSSGEQAIAVAPAAVQKITGTAQLTKQTITTTDAGGSSLAFRTISHEVVCWPGMTGCTGEQLGWYAPLPATNEQVIFDPIISPDGELVVNTFIPNVDTPLSCTSGLPTGFSMGFQPDSGAGSPIPFFTVNSNQNADGIQLNGTGLPSFVMSGQSSDFNAEYLLTQTTSGAAAKAIRVNRHAVVTGQRLNWIERR